jgi:hypothetical protein
LLTLYSYPRLFGVADNNGYGLKVFAFLKLTGVPSQAVGSPPLADALADSSSALSQRTKAPRDLRVARSRVSSSQ